MDLPIQSKLIIISSPSGAGKSTLCRMLATRNSDIKLSISSTTRKQRPGEINGQDYDFLTQDQFDKMLSDGQFIEYANIFGNNYGTSKARVENELRDKNNILFDIDWQGARQLSSKFDKSQIISIFILPPSIEELQRRLKNRAQDSLEVVLKRMAKAKDEMGHWEEYDHVLINDDLEKTYQNIINIINFPKTKTDKSQIRSLIAKIIGN